MDDANGAANLRSMKPKLIRDFALAATLFVAGFGVSVSAAEKAAPLPADERAAVRAPEKGKPGTKPAVSAEVQRFNERRQLLLAQREQLEQQLKTATEAQKKEIYAKIEAQRKEQLEMQRAMARQIREDARKRLNDPAPAVKP